MDVLRLQLLVARIARSQLEDRIKLAHGADLVALQSEWHFHTDVIADCEARLAAVTQKG